MDEVARAIDTLIASTAAPAEVSIEEARRLAERDAKFERIAAENRERAAARKARGERSPLESIVARVAAALPVSGSVVGRITPEEGDPFEHGRVPESVLTELVPPRFSAATFDSYQPKVTSQDIALRSTRKWVDCARRGDGIMLALVGPTGNGKSHLLYAAANALLGSPPRYPLGCFSRPWAKLANGIRYGGDSPFAPGSFSEASELRALLWRQRVVLIDEVRPTAGTAFDDTELAMFACHAYDAKVSVLITSNVCPLENVMGAPAASRFVQVAMDGPDWRQL